MGSVVVVLDHAKRWCMELVEEMELAEPCRTRTESGREYAGTIISCVADIVQH